MGKYSLSVRVVAVVATTGWLAAAALPAFGDGLGNEIAQAGQEASYRDRLTAMMDRPEVLAELVRIGIPVAETQQRVAALSDGDAALLLKEMDALPARGADVLGALLLISIVLLMTDVLGFTKVFSFTRSLK